MNAMSHAAKTGATLVLLLGLASASLAQQRPQGLEPLPEIPPPPRMSQPADPRADDNEPAVTIRQQDGNRIEEYRVRGRLYAIRVTPPVGRPYLLVDQTGKGVMTRMDDMGGGVRPPQWTLFEF